MRNFIRYAAAPLCAALISCAAESVPDDPIAVQTAALTAGVIRMGCAVVPGSSATTLDTCTASAPESVTRIEFVADVFRPNTVEWRIELPPGEPLRVLQGCRRDAYSCTLGVAPRCGGEPRVFRVTTRDNNASGVATATVPPGNCNLPPPPPAPPPVIDPQCRGGWRGALCNFDFSSGQSEGDQCDGIGQCVDCTDNGGCDEASICYGGTCVPDIGPLPPGTPILPPPPPPPPPLPRDPVEPLPPLYEASPDCIGAPAGALCSYSDQLYEAGQCDGQGACVDCVNNGGCDESSACTAQQVCVLITDLPEPGGFRCLAEWVTEPFEP
jgi:hypothetical protein